MMSDDEVSHVSQSLCSFTENTPSTGFGCPAMISQAMFSAFMNMQVVTCGQILIRGVCRMTVQKVIKTQNEKG